MSEELLDDRDGIAGDEERDFETGDVGTQEQNQFDF